MSDLFSFLPQSKKATPFGGDHGNDADFTRPQGEQFGGDTGVDADFGHEDESESREFTVTDVCGQLDYLLREQFPDVKEVLTFQEAGLMTRDEGVVLETSSGQKFQITVVQVGGR